LRETFYTRKHARMRPTNCWHSFCKYRSKTSGQDRVASPILKVSQGNKYLLSIDGCCLNH
jgi:hypothetical protein